MQQAKNVNAIVLTLFMALTSFPVIVDSSPKPSLIKRHAALSIQQVNPR
jgi:hypothetical protein